MRYWSIDFHDIHHAHGHGGLVFFRALFWMICIHISCWLYQDYQYCNTIITGVLFYITAQISKGNKVNKWWISIQYWGRLFCFVDTRAYTLHSPWYGSHPHCSIILFLVSIPYSIVIGCELHSWWLDINSWWLVMSCNYWWLDIGKFNSWWLVIMGRGVFTPLFYDYSSLRKAHSAL